MSTVQDREVEIVDTAVVAWTSGPARELADRIASAFSSGASHVVVDLGDAEMVDSSILTTLHRVARQPRRRGGRIAVVCAHPGLASLLRMTLLDRSFDVLTSRDAALRATQ